MEPFADALGNAVQHAIWIALADDAPDAIYRAYSNVCADPDCERGPDEHAHVTADIVADELAKHPPTA